MATPIEHFSAKKPQQDEETFKTLELKFDDNYGILWKFIANHATNYFSIEQLNEIRTVQSSVSECRPLPLPNYNPQEVKYLVFGSKLPGIFSLGGDLQLFRNNIANRDRVGMESYARIATDAVYNHATNSRNVTTFSLVQGTALGGGFEAALAGNVVVAERGTRMGFPEVLFGLFPGMGAYTLLRRRVNQSIAEKIILSANNYAAEELFEMGIIDLLVDPGEGERAINSYVSRSRNRPGFSAFRKALNRAHVVDHDELYTIADEWVNAAMDLPREHLKRFDRLIKRQKNLESPVSQSKPTILNTSARK